MQPKAPYLVGLLVALSALSGCCSWWGANIKESHLFQVDTDDGNRAYYRVEVEGNARLAKTHYRAGLYDAAALAEFLGTSDGGGFAPDLSLEKQRQVAVQNVGSQLVAELQNGSTEEAGELAQRLVLLSRPVHDMAEVLAATADTTGQKPLPPPLPQKFAIIFASDASAVQGVMADFAESKELTQIAMSQLAGQRRTEYVRAQEEKGALVRTQETVRAIKQRLDELTPPKQQAQGAGASPSSGPAPQAGTGEQGQGGEAGGEAKAGDGTENEEERVKFVTAVRALVGELAQLRIPEGS